MNNYISALINKVIRIFNKRNIIKLQISQSDVILNDIKNSGIVKILEEEIHRGINIREVDEQCRASGQDADHAPHRLDIRCGDDKHDDEEHETDHIRNCDRLPF